MNGYGRGADNHQKKDKNLITKETLGITFLLFSALLLIILCIGQFIFGEIGVAITAFVLGIFGYLAYPLLAMSIYLSVTLIIGKKLFATKWLLHALSILCATFLIVHLATTEGALGVGYGNYLSLCWNGAKFSVAYASGGGVLFGLLVYPIAALFSKVGAYIFFSILLIVTVFLTLRATPLLLAIASYSRRPKQPKERVVKEKNVRTEGTKAYPGTFSFEDLPSPQPRGTEQGYTPYAEQGYQEPYAPQQQPYPPQQPYGGYAGQGYTGYPQQNPYVNPVQQRDYNQDPPTGRDILYSADPGQNYRNNLIYRHDSAFNTTKRRSSMEREEPVSYTPPQGFERPSNIGKPTYIQPTPTVSYPTPTPSYHEQYSQQAETVRPSMPRKIVEQPMQREGTLTSADELNYPQIPSYKTPETPVNPDPTIDWYQKDVPFKPSASVDANLDAPEDYPVWRIRESTYAKPKVETPAEEQPSELKRASITPEPEPVKSEPTRITPAWERGEENPFDTPTQTETPRVVGFGDTNTVEEPHSVGFDKPIDRLRPSRLEQPEEEIRSSRLEQPEEGIRPSRLEQPEEEIRPSRLGEGESRIPQGIRGRESNSDLLDEDEITPPAQEIPSRGPRMSTMRPQIQATEIPSTPAPKPQRHIYKRYVKPSTDTFITYENSVGIAQEELDRNSEIIVETMAAFRVEATIMKVTVGPTVTRYDVSIPRNVPIRTAVRLDEEVASALRAKNGVNMYSNTEIGAISIEVPNSVKSIVGIGEVMKSKDYTDAKKTALAFVIGKDVEGRNVCGDICKMTHILVAGTTNSGKSCCINSMLVSLICKYSPEQLRLILIDPKKNEFVAYDGLPHLMINEIISDAQKAVTALNWAIKEMERRYDLFAAKSRAGTSSRNIDEYNEAVTEDEEPLPKIVIVVDELADLMSVAKKDIEERIQRLTQKARAAGIHLVLATQRPSVDVITGVIKGNLPTRMAFRVIQEVDSRTILDETGAQKLLGMGDMLYKAGGMFSCARVQGALVEGSEIHAIVREIKQNNEAYFDPQVEEYFNKTETVSASSGDGADVDGAAVGPEYIKALGFCVKLGTASISFVQRKCGVGYNHAGRIMEWMELMEYITPFEGKAKARTVLLTQEEFESIYGSLE